MNNTEPYWLGLAQGRLQAEACSLELPSPTFGYLAAIRCREWAEGVCCMSFAQGLCGSGTFSRGRRVDWRGAICLTRRSTACDATFWHDCIHRDSVLVLHFSKLKFWLWDGSCPASRLRPGVLGRGNGFVPYISMLVYDMNDVNVLLVLCIGLKSNTV